MDTAPASPVNMPPPQNTTTTTTTSSHPMPPEHATLAQLSFGPATQRTVTTVTTTTVVQLPPLVVKPPKDLLERDPKQYPLAFTPTPNNIRRFCFDVNGNPTTFQEAEDPNETLKAYHRVQAKIQKSNGTIRQEEKDDYQTPVRGFRPPHLSKKVHSVRASSAPKRTATPPSIADAAELASLHRRAKKPRSQLHRTHSEQDEFPSLNQREASGAFDGVPSALPVTPVTDTANPRLPGAPRATFNRRRQSPTRPSQSRLQQLHDENIPLDGDEHMSEGLDQDEGSQLGPPLYGKRAKSGGDAAHAEQSHAAVATPPIADVEFGPAAQEQEPQRPQLPNIITNPQQDVSLPSPSLSPITAAANLASRSQNAFDASFAEHIGENVDPSSVLGLGLDDSSRTGSFKPFGSQDSSKPIATAQDDPKPQAKQGHTTSGPTVMDIPTMVEAFDGMPEGMQTYLIYQFLRRCSKTTLQTVASVVNPALKCDPFNVLPTEIGQIITRLLDAQSLCRAAQVSKTWRKLINSDEKAWKDLLDRDEFILPADEVQRAVREGWGWQHPGQNGFEQDLSKQIPRTTPERVDSSSMDGQDVGLSDDDEDSSNAGRSKKKSSLKYNRKLKRRSTALVSGQQVSSRAVSASASAAPNAWRKLLALAQGPTAFANAATHAVPHPTVGLPSLRSMHLFKSLYQRHYLIRKSWMEQSSQPQHLAFRAHHRHVVTCLLFDSDKILTGSDDTKINVYDTKTGALRKRLEGHEGGVWALQYEGDTLVSGSTDRSVRVWDIKSGQCLQVFQGHTSTVRCLVILQPVPIGTDDDGQPIMMPKEPLIITGSRDSTLRVWKLPKPGDAPFFQSGPPTNDRDNPYFLRTLSGHHNSVRAIAAHGDTLISGSYDCTVRVWKISTGDLVHRLQGHGQKVYSVVLDHERNRCISGSMDNLVKVWDLQTGSCLFNLEGHTSLVGLLDLSHDRLVSAAADSTLRIWDPENGACKATLSAHTGAITCFQHDGHKVISGSDRTLKMWNVKTGQCVRDLLTDLSGVWQVRFDERRCVAAVQRSALTYIEVLDFGAAREGVPPERLGRRICVDQRGRESEDIDMSNATNNDTDGPNAGQA